MDSREDVYRETRRKRRGREEADPKDAGRENRNALGLEKKGEAGYF